MKMKKLFTVVLAASMLLSVPVYAEETIPENVQSEYIETEAVEVETEVEVIESEVTETVAQDVETDLQIEMEAVQKDDKFLNGEENDLEQAVKDAYNSLINKNNNKNNQTNINQNQTETPKKEDGVTAFVRRLYTKVLNRQPDKNGLNDWVSQLKNRTKTGAEVAQGFICSQELYKRNLSNSAYVEMLYETFFDRASDKGGKTYWMNQLSTGMSRNYVFRGFANSAEFQKICDKYNITRGTIVLKDPMDQNEGITKFVYRCYQKFLGRKADIAGLNDWCNRLLTGKINAKQAAEGFVMSREFASMNLNYYNYVETMYWGLFDRKADAVGLESWVNKLMSGFEFIDIFNGFADSQEFRKLAASFGLSNNWKSVPFCYLVDNGIYTLEFPLSWKGKFAEAGDGFYTMYYYPDGQKLTNSAYAVEIATVLFLEDLDDVDKYPSYEVLGYSDTFDVYAVALYPTDVPFDDYHNNIAIRYFNMTSCIPYVFKSIVFK